MSEDRQQGSEKPPNGVPDNSDPTGIGPPPPGSETRVRDGQGITKGAETGKSPDSGRSGDQT